MQSHKFPSEASQALKCTVMAQQSWHKAVCEIRPDSCYLWIVHESGFKPGQIIRVERVTFCVAGQIEIITSIDVLPSKN